jgi:hypothetical protein
MPTLPNPLSSNISVTRPQEHFRKRRKVATWVMSETSHSSGLTLLPYHHGHLMRVNTTYSSLGFSLILPAAASTASYIGFFCDIVITTGPATGVLKIDATTLTSSTLIYSYTQMSGDVQNGTGTCTITGADAGSTFHLYCDGLQWYFTGHALLPAAITQVTKDCSADADTALTAAQTVVKVHSLDSTPASNTVTLPAKADVDEGHTIYIIHPDDGTATNDLGMAITSAAEGIYSSLVSLSATGTYATESTVNCAGAASITIDGGSGGEAVKGFYAKLVLDKANSRWYQTVCGEVIALNHAAT